MSTNKFFVKSPGGETIGPVTALELKQMAKSGRLTPACLVQRDGDAGRWHEAGKIKGLEFPPAVASAGPTAASAPQAAPVATPPQAASETPPGPSPAVAPSQSASSKKSSSAGGCGGFIMVLVGVAALYFSGWRVIWGLDNFEASRSRPDGSQPAVMLTQDCVAFSVSGSMGTPKYYGIGYRDRYFDSPVLSWGIGIVGVMIILAGVGHAGDTDPKQAH